MEHQSKTRAGHDTLGNDMSTPGNDKRVYRTDNNSTVNGSNINKHQTQKAPGEHLVISVTKKTVSAFAGKCPE